MLDRELPFLLDAEEAVEYLNNNRCDDAITAYAIGIMSKEGYSNKMIRDATGIDKVYTVTHYKRAGTMLSEEEILLWHNNPLRITLGHVRVVSKLNRTIRERFLRDLISKKINEKPISVSTLKDLSQGVEPTKNSDIKRLENDMEEATGRSIQIEYNKDKKTGSIKLSFFTLNDLDKLCKMVGYSHTEY